LNFSKPEHSTPLAAGSFARRLIILLISHRPFGFKKHFTDAGVVVFFTFVNFTNGKFHPFGFYVKCKPLQVEVAVGQV
jgi:hypothetical protein